MDWKKWIDGGMAQWNEVNGRSAGGEVVITGGENGGMESEGGGDGTVALWDALAKRRLKQYQKLNVSVAALAFSSDGTYLAMALSPGFEDGYEPGDSTGQVKVILRTLAPDEARPKPKK